MSSYTFKISRASDEIRVTTTKFGGMPCTYYIWPRDRIPAIRLQSGEHVLVPTFSLKAINWSLRRAMKHYIALSKKVDQYKDPHLHVLKIDGLDHEYGFVITPGLGKPAVDFFEHIIYINGQTAELRKK